MHLVNAYIMSVNINIKEGKCKKDLLLHHDFRKSVALSWIDTEAVHYSKVIPISRKTGWDTEYVSVDSTIKMNTFN